MRPKKPKTTEEGDLFRARLDQIINLKHELVCSIISHRGAPQRWVPAVRSGSNTRKLTASRFTMEQIGRELQKVYTPPDDLPPRLGRLVTRLERSSEGVRSRRERGNEGADQDK
jgi:hypothetical protein